jgi:ParB-like chromosome segregation protein Spo0J
MSDQPTWSPAPAAFGHVPITSIRIGTRHRKDQGDIEALAENIREIGLLHPPVVTPELELIAGERRLLACSLLQWTEVPVRFVNLQAVLLGEYAENEFRKDFTVSERVAIGQAIEAQLGNRQGQRVDIGRERIHQHYGCNACRHHHCIGKDDMHVCVYFDSELGGWDAIKEREEHGAQCEAWELDPDFEPYDQDDNEGDEPRFHGNEVIEGRTAKISAERAGFGGEKSYREAKQVVEHGAPELIEAMDSGRASIRAAAAIATVPQEEQLEIVSLDEAAILLAAKEIRARKRAEAPEPEMATSDTPAFDPPTKPLTNNMRKFKVTEAMRALVESDVKPDELQSLMKPFEYAEVTDFLDPAIRYLEQIKLAWRS